MAIRRTETTRAATDLNSDLGFLQTVEAGWQEFQDLTGDWVPHLFVYYTTNGYSSDGDNQGGYRSEQRPRVSPDRGSRLAGVPGPDRRLGPASVRLLHHQWLFVGRRQPGRLQI